MKIEQWS